MLHYLARAKQIAKFSRTGKGLLDQAKCAVVGFARGHPFTIGSVERVCMKLRLIAPLSAFVYLDDLGQLLSFEEIFVEKVYDLDLVPFAPEVVLDCGAHVGFFSLLAARRCRGARIVAFEPAPENFRVLEEQVKLNALNWELQQCAVDVRDGDSFFESGAASNVGHLLENGVADEAAPYVVRTVDLATCVRERAPGSLLLKVDVEGAEKFLLPAILDALPSKTAMFFETHHGEPAREEIYSLLRTNGFAVRCFRVREPYADSFAVRM
ncbi:MAG TPA: FkbM family methyltransferase [Chthoniobacterales bacterium]|jgi:FkbM family methyltransferase